MGFMRLFVQLRSILLILVFLLLPLICSLFLIYFGLKWSQFQENDSFEETSVHEYQTLRYEPETKQSWLGMVSLDEEIEVGYKSYFSEETGEYVLISNIGSGEYICTGTCFCEEKRRVLGAASSTIKRSVLYLVSALSVAVAANLASDHFQNECEVLLLEDEECSSRTQIRSEVEECVSVFHKSDSKPEIDILVGKNKKKIEVGGEGVVNDQNEVTEENLIRKIGDKISIYGDDYKTYNFWCKGHCVPSEYYKEAIKLMDPLIKDIAKEKDKMGVFSEIVPGMKERELQMIEDFCKTIKLEEEIVIDSPREEENEMRASIEFQRNLIEVCKQGSRRLSSGAGWEAFLDVMAEKNVDLLKQMMESRCSAVIGEFEEGQSGKFEYTEVKYENINCRRLL